MRTTLTVVGPLKTQEAAEHTANTLGRSNHSVFSVAVKGADGYDTGERQWFVERDATAPSSTVFGYSWSYIHAKQQRKT